MSKHLFTWMGTADLNGIHQPLRAGPVAAALKDKYYDEVHLLRSPRDQLPEKFHEKWDIWCEWVQEYATKRFTSIANPALRTAMDWEGIMDAARSAIKTVIKKDPKGELTFFLSPGTSAMSAVWIILSKTDFQARLVESSNWETKRDDSLQLTEVPFALALRRGAGAGGLMTFEDIPDRHEPMKDVLDVARRAAQTDAAILLHAETGSGKEVFAQAIHRESPRAGGRLVPCNCAAFSPALVESELFGHRKGAFTDAKEDRAGLFEAANGGTVFLDEVGELSLETQAKLLRVLDQGRVRRLGETDERPIDVRIVAATNRDLKKMCRDRTFREDLYYRLAPITIGIPPLRRRHPDDRRAHLTREFDAINGQFGRRMELSDDAWSKLDEFAWPGNIREVKNVMQYCMATVPADGVIRAKHLAVRLDDPITSGHPILDRPLAECDTAEKLLRYEYVKRAIQKAGTQVAAAELLPFQHGAVKESVKWARDHAVE